MKTDVQGLKNYVEKKGLSCETVAKYIGIDPSTFYRKMKSEGEKFTIGEIHKMVECIPMTKEEACSIFLP